MNFEPKIKREFDEETKRKLKENGLLTISQYAHKHNKSEWAVRWMCRQGRLACKKLGGMWVIEGT